MNTNPLEGLYYNPLGCEGLRDRLVKLEEAAARYETVRGHEPTMARLLAHARGSVKSAWLNADYGYVVSNPDDYLPLDPAIRALDGLAEHIDELDQARAARQLKADNHLRFERWLAGADHGHRLDEPVFKPTGEARAEAHARLDMFEEGADPAAQRPPKILYNSATEAELLSTAPPAWKVDPKATFKDPSETTAEDAVWMKAKVVDL